MCLLTTNKTLYTAEEDIVVYKMLHYAYNELRAAMQRTPYELGFTYTTEMVEVTDVVEMAAYDTKACEAFCNEVGIDNLLPLSLSRVGKGVMLAIGIGFHSAYTRDRYRKCLFSWEVIVKGIIPKGSKYYKDSTGLLVSNSIRLDEVVERSE